MAEGGCLCGANRYAFDGDPVMAVACHCRHCQKQTGSSFSAIVAVPSDVFHQLTGSPKVYEDEGESGKAVHRHFCGKCGSPLYTLADAAPGLVLVKAGTLDDAARFPPSMHVYARSKHDWLGEKPLPEVETLPE